MTDELIRMMELSQQGFYCSQIMIIMALEAQGKSNPDLVRAMSGLLGGIGFCGKTCGTLTGGACLIGLYAGKGTVEEQPDSRLYLMMSELVEWFEKEYSSTVRWYQLFGYFAGRPPEQAVTLSSNGDRNGQEGEGNISGQQL